MKYNGIRITFLTRALEKQALKLYYKINIAKYNFEETLMLKFFNYDPPFLFATAYYNAFKLYLKLNKKNYIVRNCGGMFISFSVQYINHLTFFIKNNKHANP